MWLTVARNEITLFESDNINSKRRQRIQWQSRLLMGSTQLNINTAVLLCGLATGSTDLLEYSIDSDWNLARHAWWKYVSLKVKCELWKVLNNRGRETVIHWKAFPCSGSSATYLLGRGERQGGMQEFYLWRVSQLLKWSIVMSVLFLLFFFFADCSFRPFCNAWSECSFS